mmetsp:Transcript_1520/g.4004  ORF Transcript_1520/g.4004 Transcript_1520/m.4004 type:complete len:255 (-) Transcript_1520:101-865(-)
MLRGQSQLERAAARRRDRSHRRRAEAILLERLHARDRGATRRAHLVLEVSRVLARLEDHRRRALHCLRGERLRDRPRQARAHAAVCERLDEQEAVRGAGAGEACDRIHQLFRHLLRAADRRKEVLDGVGVGGGGARATTEARGAFAHEARQVGHHADHARALGQVRLHCRERHASGDGDDQLRGADEGADLVENGRNYIGLDGQPDDVAARHSVLVVRSRIKARGRVLFAKRRKRLGDARRRLRHRARLEEPAD